MTTTSPVAVGDIEPIRRDEAAVLAAAGYDRLLAELRALPPDGWRQPTDCAEWDVRLLVAHLLGAAEATASVPENLRQLARGAIAARRRGAGTELVDGINEVQVRDRAGLSPDELVRRLASVAPAAVRGRRRTPAPLRRLRVSDGIGGRITMGFLVDVIYTRDVWVHRIDIARAAGTELALAPEAEGRIVADAVADWARRHCQPFVLHLTGPAGGTFVAGVAGEEIELDAVEFCRTLSGRREGTGLLTVPVPF